MVIVRHGRLITPTRSDNVLEGITLESVFTLAKEELGLEVIERTIDRSELYIADEVLPDGHGGAHLARDRGRPARQSADGGIGPDHEEAADAVLRRHPRPQREVRGLGARR